jgi:hypothetical protein
MIEAGANPKDARCKDHFLVGRDILHGAVCHYLNAHATSAFEVQFQHVGVELQSEVRPRQRWAQEGANCAYASPIRGDVHVDVSGAGAHRSVRVIQNRHAHLAGCVDDSGRGW